ncbi:hypothetical protein V8G54_019827 [Vigna mungo]|uniref:Uncharacterized protein n=1 Tax=Vigna mungo TaxID=3915 RepID=A0AAQ3RW53_VIGMU
MRIDHAQRKRFIPSVHCRNNSDFIHMLLQLGVKSIIGSHLQLMVITKHKWLLIHSQEENTFTAISNTNTFCCYNYMNTLTVFHSHSLSRKKRWRSTSFLLLEVPAMLMVVVSIRLVKCFSYQVFPNIDSSHMHRQWFFQYK